MTPGEYIRELRIKRKLSKSALQRLLGVAWTTVNNWENHGVTPDTESVTAIAAKLKLTPNERARLFDLVHAREPSVSEAAPLSSPEKSAERQALNQLLTAALVPDRHTIEDAYAVLSVMTDATALVKELADPQATVRAWLDAAGKLRAQGLKVTAPAIAALMLEAGGTRPTG